MNRDWTRNFPTRRNLFLAGGGLAFTGLAAQLAHLQLFRADEFESKADANRIRLEPAPPRRGVIYDREGRILAGNKRNFYVTLRPELAGSNRDVADVVERLGRLLPLSDSRKRSILQDAQSQARFIDILVADDLTWEDFSRVNVMRPELNGVEAEVGELRSYPYYAAFYHTVGYVQKANEKDVARMVEAEMIASGESPDSPAGRSRMATVRRLYKHPQMRVGKQGVEAFAEAQLKGEAGRTRVKVNASGRVIERLDSSDIAGRQGNDLVLSIDAELQNFAIQRFGVEAGSLVVVDIQSGEIIVMMSTPAPDPNNFVSGISQTAYTGLLNDERNPLYHKAYDGTYPPGSTFKAVVAAAALESGAVTPEFQVRCTGRTWFGNRFFHCWERKGHGVVNVHTALQRSCDIYFYEAARRAGIENVAAMAKKFGLGHRYELGLTGGRAGVVPNDAWKREALGEQWYEGETLSVGIGQGYMSASPLQMAIMVARVAGGPNAKAPSLLMSGAQAKDDTVAAFEGVSEETMNRVRAGMYAVTSEAGGTAVRSGMLDPDGTLQAPFTNARMAGKSGTAQVRVISAAERATRVLTNAELPWRLRDHALFVAYAPAENPRYAGACVVEHGDSGSRVAAPILRDVLTATLRADPGSRPAYRPTREVVTAPHPSEPT